MDLDELDDPFLTPSKSSRNPSSSPRSVVRNRRAAPNLTKDIYNSKDIDSNIGAPIAL